VVSDDHNYSCPLTLILSHKGAKEKMSKEIDNSFSFDGRR
jgi:hypothetical protein